MLNARWNRISFGSLGIVAANFVLLLVFYNTVGWFYFRGYNEVVNFLIMPGVAAIAVINLILAIPPALYCLLRRRSGGLAIAASLVASAAITVSSLWVAPSIGRFAARHLLIKTPLVDAAAYDDPELVIILLNHGADPNSRVVGRGITALHCMAYAGQAKAVQRLLDAGADPNAFEIHSHATPLHFAVRGRCDVPTIEMLFRHGADPTMKDSEGKTPRDYVESSPAANNPALWRLMRMPGGPPSESPRRLSYESFFEKR